MSGRGFFFVINVLWSSYISKTATTAIAHVLLVGDISFIFLKITFSLINSVLADKNKAIKRNKVTILVFSTKQKRKQLIREVSLLNYRDKLNMAKQLFFTVLNTHTNIYKFTIKHKFNRTLRSISSESVFTVQVCFFLIFLHNQICSVLWFMRFFLRHFRGEAFRDCLRCCLWPLLFCLPVPPRVELCKNSIADLL